MERMDTATAAGFEVTSFLGYFKTLPDHRQAGKVTYPLDEILLLALLAVLAGAEGFTDIARFGEKKLALLRRFRPFADGTPSHDHLGDIFATLDAEAFRRCFAVWVAALTKTPAGIIAIDGKTSRRSGRKGAGDAIHTVSAFAARQRLVLAQTKVDEKANEIVAIPALLDLLTIEGAIVTIDAMGCQRSIAQKIIDRQADYVLALKGNQGTLREDVGLFAKEQKKKGFSDTVVTTARTVDGDHGRIETRLVTVVHDVGWLNERHAWPGLKGLVIVDSTREIGARMQAETRYYLTSSSLSAEQIETKLPDITEFARTYLGVDPITELVPVFPTAHYAMGGIPTNIETEVLRDNDTVVPGLYAAGECACVSVHGANRLGTNSLLDINVFGRRAGIAAAAYAVGAELPDLPENPAAFVEGLVSDLRDSTGGERVGEIRKAMQETMDMNAQVYRTEATLKQALSDVQELQRRFRNVAIHDKGERYNTELLEAIELGFLLDLAEILVVGALERKESRGGHAREDYQARDDVNFMRHTMAYRHVSENGDATVRLDYKPVVVTRYQPMERKY